MVHVVVTREAGHASADYIWSKLAQYSDMSWHPLIKSSRNVGSIEDGSDNMVGAVRVLVNDSGKELHETVTEWDEQKKFFALSIDKGGPPFAKKLLVGFQVCEEGGRVFVDVIADACLKAPFIILAPLVNVALPKKLGPLTHGIADLKE